MTTKNIALLAVLLPGLALLSACNRHDADDVAPATTAATTPAPAPAPEPAMAPAMAPPPTPAPADATGSMAQSGEMSFADMDKNHDGSLTADELSDTDMLHEHFSAADTDGNGKLSEAEVAKHRAAMPAAPAN